LLSLEICLHRNWGRSLPKVTFCGSYASYCPLRNGGSYICRWTRRSTERQQVEQFFRACHVK